MKPTDIYALPNVEDPRLSPDGTQVAFVVTVADEATNQYRSDIHLVPVDGSAPPRRLTSSGARDMAPRWSPDGTRIAFVSTRTGVPQLHVIAVEGGEAIRLTDMVEGAAEHAWSPDSSRLAFTAAVRHPAYDEADERRRQPRRITRLRFKLDGMGWICDRHRHVFVVPADGSASPTQLTDGEYQDAQPAYSPDGSCIAFVSSRSEDWDLTFIRDVFTVPAEGGPLRRLTDGTAIWAFPSWSPDGRAIACRRSTEIDATPKHSQIAVLQVADGHVEVPTATLDRNCSPIFEMREPIWLDGDLLFPVEDAGYTHLYRVPADASAAPTLALGGRRVVAGHDAVGEVLVHIETTSDRPGELYHGERALTEVTAAFRAGRRLSKAERFLAPSTGDAVVEAWVMRPLGFRPGRRYPVLLNIHGGPYAQYRDAFFDEFQVYAEAGYVVLFCNPRGSSSHSQAWARGNQGPAAAGPGMGTVDYQDVMAVVDEALRRFDFCDPDRLGVMGGSYGGFMTSWVVTQTNRFRAACSERGVSSWATFYGTSDLGPAIALLVGAPPHRDPQAFQASSVVARVADITTPLLLLHSENDLRAGIDQSEQLFVALRLLKREVELLRFSAENHDLSRSGSPVHRVMRFDAILGWFGRHLQPSPTKEKP